MAAIARIAVPVLFLSAFFHCVVCQERVNCHCSAAVLALVQGLWLLPLML
jgi:hypothetical protein